MYFLICLTLRIQYLVPSGCEEKTHFGSNSLRTQLEMQGYTDQGLKLSQYFVISVCLSLSLSLQLVKVGDSFLHSINIKAHPNRTGWLPEHSQVPILPMLTLYALTCRLQ